jgi:predicted nucleic acid-binding protein
LKVAFDSNILVYLAKVWKVDGDIEKTRRIEALILAFADTVDLIAPLQTLGESYQVMARFGFPRIICQTNILKWIERFETVSTSATAFEAAVRLATDHKLQFWDALIITIAAEARCELLLSEDMQPGFTWHGLTVVNPLAETLDERLVRLLDAP